MKPGGLAALAATLLLGACAGDPARPAADAEATVLAARLASTGDRPGQRLQVERDGRTWVGLVRFERSLDLGALQARYASEPKRLQRIVAGLERGPAGERARVTAAAPEADGRLDCELLRGGGRLSGTCRDEQGKGFRLRFDG